MSKHTPGPWIVLPDLTIRVREWQHCQQMGDHQGCIIADLKPALGVSTDTPEGVALSRRVRDHAVEETDANARLIAAAPELLAVLQMVLEYACHDDDRDGRQATLTEMELANIEAAVARATGQT